MIKVKPAYVIFLGALFAISISCRKSSTPPLILERVDTVRYEAILDSNTHHWGYLCVIPPFDSILEYFNNNYANAVAHQSLAKYGFTAGGGGYQNTNEEFIFTVNKYKNKSITLEFTAINGGGGPPFLVDSPVTLNIYINDSIVATQTNSIKDSIHYVYY